MSLIERVAAWAGFERRALSDSSWAALAPAGVGSASPDVVLSNSAVAVRCISLRSELMASVGLHLFRRSANGGRDRADDLALYGVLHDQANEQMSSFEFREFMVRCLDLHGNAYARIERDAGGRVTALHPLHPGTVSIEKLPSGRLRYRLQGSASNGTVLLQEEVMHLRGPSKDGVTGLSPIAMARGTFNLAIAQRQTAAALMENSLRPSAVISYPGVIGPEAQARWRAAINERLRGADKAGTFLLFDNGAKFEKMTFSPEDAEFLDSMKLANEDVARTFGVPPTAVGILDRGTYSNVEQEAASLIQNCLGPLAARIEAAMSRCLLTPDSRRSLYIEFDLSSLLRGDVKSRFEAYRVAREIGVYSANDVRRRENEPPIEGGDAYHMPSNWMPLGSKPLPSGGPA